MSATRYTYYPGCSGKGVGRAYEESLLAVFEHLGAGLDELEDWNCCGATAWPSVDEDQAIALAARNLALAEDRAPGAGPVDLRRRVHRLLPGAACGPSTCSASTGPRARQGRRRARRDRPATTRAGSACGTRSTSCVNEIGLDRIREAVVAAARPA